MRLLGFELLRRILRKEEIVAIWAKIGMGGMIIRGVGLESSLLRLLTLK